MFPGTDIASVIIVWTKYIGLLTGLCLACSSLEGQRYLIPRMYLEGGAGINLAYFDVGGGSPGLSVQGHVFYDLGRTWRVGIGAGWHRTQGTDEGTYIESRGYAFKSNLFEVSVRGMYVLRFKPYPIVRWRRKLEPRAYAGLGVLQISPAPNQALALQSNDEPLRVAPVFSGGIGLAYRLKDDLSLVVEGGSSFSTSDYLEGYTNHEHSSASDMYHTIMLKMMYRIPAIWY